MDRYIVLAAFAVSLIAVVVLAAILGAADVRSLELVPVVSVLGGALAGLAKR